jgi:RNA polymerase sigma-70 factor (ECF subfamily)
MEAKPIETSFTAKLAAAQPETALEKPGTADERHWTRLLAEHDPQALAWVYDRYAPALYRMLQTLLTVPADAEDALQNVFVKLATGRIGRVRDLKSYLFVAARHEAYSLLRKQQRESALPAAEELVTGSDQSTSPHDWATLLARLPLEQREVIALKVWEEMTFAQIAKIVNVSPNTVMSRYRYAIEHLRNWCGEENTHEH